MEVKNQILESYHKMQEMYSPFEKAEQPPAPETDPMDLVTMDIPLLIRLFELMHEDVQDDAQLHEITTRILEVSKQSTGPLTMENYNEILNGQSDEPMQEGQYNGSSNSLLNQLEAKYGEDVINDFDSIKLNIDNNQYEFKPTKRMHGGITYYEVFKNHNFMGEYETAGILRLIKTIDI